MAKCIIIGAGDFNSEYLVVNKNDFIIAADGGYDAIDSIGIRPHMWIGDMDSTKSKAENKSNDDIEIVRLPREKDDTDTLAAIRIGIEKGYKEFSLHGMLGGRLDHTLANISCLQYLDMHDCRGVLYGSDTILVLLKNAKLTFDTGLYGMLSVFACGDKANGVTEKGLLYEIEQATLTPEFPIGVSNELIGNEAYIIV